MTHYTVHFTGTKQEMVKQAWDHTQYYLGQRGIERLTAFRAEFKAKKCRSKIHAARLFCSFNGIRGFYPVRAVTLFMFEKIEPSADHDLEHDLVWNLQHPPAKR